MKKAIYTFAILTLFTACNKEEACTTLTQIGNNGPLISLADITQQAPSFVDSLNKYPQLQAYKFSTEQGFKRLDCHVYYYGLRMFSNTYGLMIPPGSNQTQIVGNNVSTFNINIDTIPQLSFQAGVDIAKQELNFDQTCISYTLGIWDKNSDDLQAGATDYKLVWKVEGENEFPYVMLDANTGTVYRKDSGVWE